MGLHPAHGAALHTRPARLLQLACRLSPPGARPGALPSVENACSFCFPLGVDAVKPSAYLVTSDFSFTLTDGSGGRLHGFARRTHDPTHRPPAGARERWPQVLCILTQHCWQPFFCKVLEVSGRGGGGGWGAGTVTLRLEWLPATAAGLARRCNVPPPI